MFTDRFIKLPTREYNAKHKDLTGQEIMKDSFEKLNPLDISSYRPANPEEDPEIKCVSIDLKNGNSILAYLSLEEFERLINHHQK